MVTYTVEKINLSLQIVPIIEDEGKMYGAVDKVIEMIAKSGYKYEVGPMETTIEGDIDGLLQLVKDAQKICVEEGAVRVVVITSYSIHYTKLYEDLNSLVEVELEGVRNKFFIMEKGGTQYSKLVIKKNGPGTVYLRNNFV